MKTTIISMLTITVLAACQNKEHEFEANTKRMQLIDQLDFTTKRFQIQLDSNQLPVDTVEVIWYKKDEDGEIVYKQVECTTDTTTYYYWEDGDLLYRELTAISGTYNSKYQTLRNKSGRIEKAIIVTENLDYKDTLIMDYKYQLYDNGKKKQLSITSKMDKDTAEGIIWYNDMGNCTSEIEKINGDTTSRVLYEYRNDKLASKIIIRGQFPFEQKYIIEYNQKGLPIKESSYRKTQSEEYFENTGEWKTTEVYKVDEKITERTYGADDLIMEEVNIDLTSKDTTVYHFEYLDLPQK